MVTTEVVSAPAGEFITLYLELKPGERADLEVVGRAAAAFSEAIKEISYVLDPGIELRLEFESGTEGSLKLNARLRALRDPGARRAALLSVIATVGITLGKDLQGYGVGKILDHFFHQEQCQQLIDDDIQRIAKAVNAVKDGKMAKEPLQEMYAQLERDQAIQSVGATAKPDAKPENPVPRSEFLTRAGIVPAVETALKTRAAQSTERLTLISPVLLPADRIWRFRSPVGEFGYHMKDEKFREDLLAGRRRLAMKAGIQVTAIVETQQVFEGNVWVPKERSIIKVLGVHREPEPPDLFSQPKKRRASKKKKR